ncbi:response regulator [Nonlabens xiamenensis]|uniref:response regulator n=1 Tax=Nonlabens xiamenensis TaxID=2341043 RepID=UPI000F612EEB|nr:response regulator [Nonlabens xiamenensis]
MNTGKRTLIHIEDRMEDIQLVKRVLEKQFDDVAVVSLNDSEKVMEEISNGSFLKRRPFLIVMDIKMPKITGLELLRELRSRDEYKRIPCVILSSSTHPNDLQEAYDHHVNSYVEKPKNFANLRATLVTLVNYWLNLNLT